jgi:hypothetical protein
MNPPWYRTDLKGFCCGKCDHSFGSIGGVIDHLQERHGWRLEDYLDPEQAQAISRMEGGQ